MRRNWWLSQPCQEWGPFYDFQKDKKDNKMKKIKENGNCNKWEGIGDYPNPVKNEVPSMIFKKIRKITRWKR